MSNPENLSSKESDDIGDYPLQVQFSARMAILNAQVRAKIIDGTYKPKKFICKFKPTGSFSNFLD